MRIFKSHPFLKMVNSYVIDSPQPSNISYLWNFGSLLAFCLIIQIVTGVTLAMHYNPSVLEAFNSVEHIMRDVNNGWLIRYLHSNTASAFFFLVYLHIGRGLYYGSYRAPRTLVWTIGTVIFILMMATAFLGYVYSPKWYELNLNLLFSYNIVDNYYFFNILSSVAIISFILYYLDNFNLSDVKIIRYIQILSFISIILFILLICFLSYENMTSSNVILSVGDMNNEIGTKINNNVNLQGHVHVNDKEAGKSIATQVGITGAMVGGALGVGKAIAKSPMPPLQKAGLIVGASVAAGAGQALISGLSGNIGASSTSNTSDGNISKFLADSQNSVLQNSLFLQETMYLICVYIVLLIAIQLVFKLHFKDSINLNLSKLLGSNLNSKVEYYLNKIIKLNKQMSVVWMWFGVIVITYGIGASIYANYLMYLKIDDLVNTHTPISNDIMPTLYKSIEDAVFNLGIVNYLSLGIIINLIVILLLRFHFNKEIRTIYIWLLIILLIIALAYSVYMSGELHTNVDSYVNIYNIKKEEIIFLGIINTNRRKFNVFQPFYKQLSYNSTINNNVLDSFLKENKLKPVYIYNNLHLGETRKTILENTKNLSGIYLIFNKITGDYYIGSAATNRFYARFSNHLIYFRGSKILKNAVRKYNLSNFVFLILDLFPEIVNQENNKKLLDLEDFYLKSLLPNYNILTEAGSSFGYKHTELSRIKMKMSYSIQRRELIGSLNKNKKLPMETRLKMKEKALTKEKISFSEQALLNMKKNSKAIILYNLDHTVFGEYSSIIEAAKSINCDAKTIRRALKTEKKILKRRFILKYIEK